jgi:hypothetical protein
MTYRLDVWDEPHYLYAHVTGERKKENIPSLVRAIASACVCHGRNRVLVDLREFDGSLGVYDTFSIPVAVFPSVKEFDFVDQIALVDSAARRQRAEFLSDLARKGGYNFRAFPDLDPALKWLTPPAESTAS